ncbi:unnamed protein product [Arctogadus glacialis]
MLNPQDANGRWTGVGVSEATEASVTAGSAPREASSWTGDKSPSLQWEGLRAKQPSTPIPSLRRLAG